MTCDKCALIAERVNSPDACGFSANVAYWRTYLRYPKLG